MYYALRRLTRVLYRLQGTGLPRIAETIRRWAAKSGPTHPLVINDFYGAKFYCFLREHMGGQIFFRGHYSGAQLRVVKEILPIDGVFLDIGANQGEFSIFAAQIAPRGQVLAFEPVSRNRDRLLHNIELNGFRHILVMPFACGEETGESPIYDATAVFTDGSVHEGLHTLYSSHERSALAEQVTVRRLDYLLTDMTLPRIDLIKMDIEGAELFALRGAAETIGRYHPAIILEISRETCCAAGYQPENILILLQRFGYQMYRIEENNVRELIGIDDLREFQNVLAIYSQA